MKQEQLESSQLQCSGIESRDWYAWLNIMPPPPDDFHVTGEVYVPNPGVEAFLAPRVPQGINPAILQLDIHLYQKPGMWTQQFVWKTVRYDKAGRNIQYTQVQIFCGEKIIADIPVEIVQ